MSPATSQVGLTQALGGYETVLHAKNPFAQECGPSSSDAVRMSRLQSRDKSRAKNSVRGEHGDVVPDRI